MEINSLLKRKFFVRKRIYKDGSYMDAFDINTYTEIYLYKLGKYIIRNEKDIGFYLNALKPGFKNAEKINFKIPIVSWIDIDFHTKKQIDDFKKDVKNLKQFMLDLKNDPNLFIIGRTLGKPNAGIRIIGLVDSYYREYEDDIIENGLEDSDSYLDKQQEIFEANYLCFKDYITNNYPIKEGSYFDTCCGRISQPTFPLAKASIRLDCENLYHTYDISNLSKPKTNVTPKQQLERATNNSKLTIQLYQLNPPELQNIFNTHCPKLEGIVKYCDTNARKAWFNLYNRYYKGNSFKKYLKDFDTFEKRLSVSKSLTYCSDLYYYLKNNGVIK
jgi:hypothetical protein